MGCGFVCRRYLRSLPVTFDVSSWSAGGCLFDEKEMSILRAGVWLPTPRSAAVFERRLFHRIHSSPSWAHSLYCMPAVWVILASDDLCCSSSSSTGPAFGNYLLAHRFGWWKVSMSGYVQFLQVLGLKILILYEARSAKLVTEIVLLGVSFFFPKCFILQFLLFYVATTPWYHSMFDHYPELSACPPTEHGFYPLKRSEAVADSIPILSCRTLKREQECHTFSMLFDD